MTWNQVLVLLHIAQMSNDFPKLHGLRNAALEALEAADVNALGFVQGEEDE